MSPVWGDFASENDAEGIFQKYKKRQKLGRVAFKKSYYDAHINNKVIYCIVWVE